MKFLQKQAFALLLAASVIALSPLAASAHDEVVGTTPGDGKTVDAGKVNVSVTFNEDIMKSADLAGEAIEVTDALGDQITLTGTCLAVDGATLTAPMVFTANGDYTVNWRSVSNDGHPNEGTFGFTVANATESGDANTTVGMGPVLGGSCSPVYSAVDRAADTTATPMVISAPAPSPSATPDPFITNLPYLGAGLILVVLGGLAGPIVQKLRQRRATMKAELKKLQDEDQ
jgi:copper resistance protein C